MACATLAHHRVWEIRGEEPESYLVSLAIQVRKAGVKGPLFQNNLSMIFFSAGSETASDVRAMCQSFQKQHAQFLKQRLGAAFRQIQFLMRRMPARMYIWFLLHQMRGEFNSFYHSNTGEFAPDLSEFYGAGIKNAWHIPSVSNPPGSGLFVNTKNGRMTVALTWREGGRDRGRATRLEGFVCRCVVRRRGRSAVNIVDQIFQNCDRTSAALIHGDERLSFGELEDLMDEAVASLRQTGWLERKDEQSLRVGLDCPNGLAHVVFSLAVLRLGGCLVPIASELRPRERDALVNATGVDIVVGISRAESGIMNRPEAPFFRGVSLEGRVVRDVRDTQQLLAFKESDLAQLNPALIRFSSGTTGKSKGRRPFSRNASRSHNHLQSAIRDQQRRPSHLDLADGPSLRGVHCVVLAQRRDDRDRRFASAGRSGQRHQSA